MTKMLTKPGIPRRSPIQVLTGPEVAQIPRSYLLNLVWSRSPIQVLTGPEVAKLLRSGILNLVWS
ncbi:unnamed protein product [Clavelina lepadiformis]|uniref:Uncharacterized protein n=1 Tax=Clavelina lepadiformis TaxID=159417 RepID=A0ABP0GXB8_CLALP